MNRFFNRRLILVCLTALAVLFLAGCTPSVVGKWKGNLTIQGQPIPVQMDFKQDGTLAQTLTAPLIGSINVSGNYKVEGDKMTLNLTEANAMGKKIPVNGLGSSSGNLSIKFEGDKLILTSKDQPLTLERVKE